MKVKMFNKKLILISIIMFSLILLFFGCKDVDRNNSDSELVRTALSKCSDTTGKNLDKDIVKRFLTYVAFDTQADNNSESFPSTAKQLELAKYLKIELDSIGMKNVELDESSGLYSTLPASEGCENKPVLAFICHIDTDDTAPGADIHTTISEVEGKSKITTDGKTLLGGDDKAGIAEIVTLLDTLVKNPSYKHPEIRFVATFDEEIGKSSKNVNLDKINAKYAYTLDGGDVGEISYETWNAADAKITFNGYRTHLGDAYGVLKNALIMANEFIAELPSDKRPETTKDRNGFISVSEQSGDIAQCIVSCDLRDFEKSGLQAEKDLLNSLAEKINTKYGEGSCVVDIKDRYPNMKEYLIPDYQFLVDRVIEANNETGITTHELAVRGGTDGSNLSSYGLPCPNLGAGQHFYHRLDEYVYVEEMESVTNMLIKLVAKFA